MGSKTVICQPGVKIFTIPKNANSSIKHAVLAGLGYGE